MRYGATEGHVECSGGNFSEASSREEWAAAHTMIMQASNAPCALEVRHESNIGCWPQLCCMQERVGVGEGPVALLVEEQC